MECILLGSGGMMPMPYRLLTSLAVRVDGQIYLFDAGEGTQLGLKQTKIGVRGLDVLAVSHRLRVAAEDGDEERAAVVARVDRLVAEVVVQVGQVDRDQPVQLVGRWW